MLERARCQTAAVADELKVVTQEPFNAETRLEIVRGTTTPAGRHYVRTHFGIPDAPSSIEIDGSVRSPLSLSVGDLRALPARTVAVTLECAGNGRAFLDPRVGGEQWELGAVGTAEWSGVRVADVLALAEPDASALEVLFAGADTGTPADLGRRISYERSLPMAVARGDAVLVAHSMDGAPIPAQHGGPLRLVVPGWYGMASVKWLARITVRDTPFVGFYQTDRYVIDGVPLRTIAPRAVITRPRDGDAVPAGITEASGYAWSGAPIARVAVAAYRDGGTIGEWHAATLGPAVSRYAWREFTCTLAIAPELARDGDEILIAARATDEDGNVQPLAPPWNRLGYSNNAVRAVRVRVRS